MRLGIMGSTLNLFFAGSVRQLCFVSLLGCLFVCCTFRNADDFWLRFDFHFGSVFAQFRTPFSDPVFACVFFRFALISGALNPPQLYNDDLRKTTQRGRFKKIFDFLTNFDLILGRRWASSSVMFLHCFLDALSNYIFSMFLKNWTPNGSQNNPPLWDAETFWPPRRSSWPPSDVRGPKITNNLNTIYDIRYTKYDIRYT